jgi:amino acid permease
MFGTSRYLFCLIPVGGYFISDEEAGTNRAKIITLAGGPCISLMQAILYGVIRFCILEFVQPGNGLYETILSVSAFLLYFNFFQFLFTVIPIRYRIICKGHESDGLQIIHVLKNKA